MKYVILLRGVNIGGRTIKSAELKSCLEKAGFKNVQTVLATGNILIDSGEKPNQLKHETEQLLETNFKFAVKVKIISLENLAKIINGFPFQNIDPDYHRYVIFKDKKSDETTLTGLNLDEKLEAIQPGEGVVYWYVLKGHSLDSDFAKLWAKIATKTFSTTRNLNTLEKILAKANSSSSPALRTV